MKPGRRVGISSERREYPGCRGEVVPHDRAAGLGGKGSDTLARLQAHPDQRRRAVAGGGLDHDVVGMAASEQEGAGGGASRELPGRAGQALQHAILVGLAAERGAHLLQRLQAGVGFREPSHELAVGPGEARALGGLADGPLEPPHVDLGLADVVEDAELDPLDGRLDVAVPGQDDDLDVRVLLLDEAGQLQAADARHLEVEDGHVAPFLGRLQGAIRVIRSHYMETLFHEEVGHHLGKGGVVVDDQHARRLGIH